MLEEHDPNVERSTTNTRKCMDTLFYYTEMQTEFQKMKRHPTMLQFFFFFAISVCAMSVGIHISHKTRTTCVCVCVCVHPYRAPEPLSQ